MKLKIFQVDAFTDTQFKGNSACVIQLNNWLSDSLMIDIAKENGVAETAFFIQNKNYFDLRWFTPEIEMDLCGHATLATAHAIIKHLNYTGNNLKFNTLSGNLMVTLNNDIYTLNFPSRMPILSELPIEISQSLTIQPIAVYKSRDFLLLYNTESDILSLNIDVQSFNKINLGQGGVIVTSKGNSSDFVSRFFTPQSSILEDPVTGSAHCTLAPFWAKQLNKNTLNAKQLSQRGGTLFCEVINDRTLIGGKAMTYLTGEITINV